MSCNLLLNYFDFGPDLPDFLFCVVNRNVHCGWMKDWQALQGELAACQRSSTIGDSL